MKRLFNLSIRKKFAVVIIPLIIIVIVFDFLQIRDHYYDYHDSIRLNSGIIVGVEINHVVHELQKERSISSGHLTSDDGVFFQALNHQREKVDSTLQKYFREISTEELKELMELHSADINSLNATFQRLGDIRDQADIGVITTEQVVNYYSEINDIALNTVDKLINETRDKEVAQQVHSIIYFLKSKEQASIERALGTQAFTQRHMEYGLYRNYTAVVAAEKAYEEDFIIISNSTSEGFFNRTISGLQFKEFERMRQILFANETFDVDPQYWYEQATLHINQLKKVEDFMSQQVLDRTSEIARNAVKEFWTFLVVDIIIALLAFLLMTTIVSNLLENVNRLEVYTQRITAGDMSQKVYVETKDELGHYANTFNIMVEEIRKSHAALKKERDRARYLYKNIYRVYQVVFENVHQGIFLLDRHYRISKLHSKAMEEIFDRSTIGSENFANFMRPLILPREVEALEMFMKHLFNDDMDEDVVNQLNPIEQVKIFTEKDGSVISKYIRVSFSRVYRKDQIINIMVTVSDETESILLQQHLDEAESKKKQETEQVLSILKIDPSVLRGYIFNAKKSLRDIYARYEVNKSDNLEELLDATFESVHNLKGNALVIGLEFMTSKFHQIEDAISDLKNQENINAKDFLTILYEIDAVDHVLSDMNEMLRKVANIYQKFPAEGQVVSNIMVIDSLEKGVEAISKETGKRVQLDFINESNLVIPEYYIGPVKDVMIQLIKNSIVHGIEKPDDRIELGKKPSGRITILVEESEKGLTVNYHDDGQGLDLDRIKAKAVERDLMTDFDADKLSEEEAMKLIFEKGFSTSDKVDTYSGRGQGMNLVKNLLDGQNVTFELKSKQGVFFGISMEWPNRASGDPVTETES